MISNFLKIQMEQLEYILKIKNKLNISLSIHFKCLCKKKRFFLGQGDTKVYSYEEDFKVDYVNTLGN